MGLDGPTRASASRFEATWWWTRAGASGSEDDREHRAAHPAQV